MTPPRDATRAVEEAHALLADAGEIRLDSSDAGTLPGPVSDAFDALDRALEKEPKLEAIVVVQPDDGEALAGDDQPPRFLWRDPAEAADTWWIQVRFGQPSDIDLRLLVLGGMPAEAALDPFSATLHAWTPSPEVWSHLVKHATGAPVVVTTRRLRGGRTRRPALARLGRSHGVRHPLRQGVPVAVENDLGMRFVLILPGLGPQTIQSLATVQRAERMWWPWASTAMAGGVRT